MDSYTPPGMKTWQEMEDLDQREALQNAQPDWLDDLLDMVLVGFATIGLISMMFIAGLYFSGFFQWLAQKMPDNRVLTFLFG